MRSSPAEWCRSSYSMQNGECVEIRSGARGLDVRDSKAPGDRILGFTASAWVAFLAAVPARRTAHDV
ncbi:DUF397 domain-containing protein [Streptomyces silvensis]|uniref:DUF397 domain-containing protein n=1 Tax=Streptomyces silvensis TaxID=1765722 RepID=A0A0W7X2Z3_9ACTN|nr:DUF397 domain-containing protein [Streptomyces silvensis]KUF17273.1 hypothetical protein AT728_15730 [Streptomyces silvensis]